MTKITKSLLLASTLSLLASCGGGGGEAESNRSEEAVAPEVGSSSQNIVPTAETGLDPEPTIVAAALPATEVANAAPDGPLSVTEAYRLVEQTTFGPTTQSIQRAAEVGPDTWINEQMTKTPTLLSDSLRELDTNRWNEYVNAWWRQIIQSDDQLRQRVAFALSEILVVSAHDGLSSEQFGLAGYYDILLRNAFGNYRDLLEEITLNPVMGEYLSMKGNRKPEPLENIQPDENYARELLQLFSIGQFLLNQDGTPQLDDGGVPLPAYDQYDIENFARVFTGWHFANAEDFRWSQNKDYLSPMRPWQNYHDTDSKTLLLGVETPGGQTAEQDLAAALDNIFNHPNVGPFISKQLIQRLVTSNPSPGYVSDVAAVFNENISGERGALGSVVKAILMHEEARSGHLENPETFGKIREPLLRLSHLWRAFEPSSINFDFSYAWVKDELAQSPLNSPSVFNFFRPDFRQPGEISDRGLNSPEFQILDETSVITITSRLLASSIWSHSFKNDLSANQLPIDISTEVDMESNRDQLLDHLNLLLLGGRMTDDLRSQVNRLMDERGYDGGESQRVVEAIFLIVSSPEAAIQL